MNRLRLLTAVLAIVALPTGVLGGPKDKPIKVKGPEKKEKSAPAPPALVLVGVAAGVAGLIRRWERQRTSR